MRRLAMVLLALALPTIPAVAEPTALRLVTGTDYAPYVDSNLPDGGPLTQVVQDAFAKSGQAVDLKVEPWRRGYEGLLALRFDATFPYIRTEQRMREVLFSDPITIVRQHLVVARGNERAAMVAGWIKGKRVCAAIGYGVPGWLDVLLRQGDVARVTPSNQNSCPSMILAGRADFIVEDDRLTAARGVESPGHDQLVIVPGPAASEGALHLIVARNHPQAQEILDRFNRGLARLRAEGAMPDLLTVKPPS